MSAHQDAVDNLADLVATASNQAERDRWLQQAWLMGFTFWSDIQAKLQEIYDARGRTEATIRRDEGRRPEGAPDLDN